MLIKRTDGTKNGELGAKRALEEDYDMLILDLLLPGVDGFDIFIRDLRSLGIIKKVEKENGVSLSRYVSSRKPFGLDGNITRTTHYKSTPTSLENAIICYRKGKKLPRLGQLRV